MSTGPGSFTGIRMGLGFAQGLADALDKPLVGVSSLEAVAQAAILDGVTGIIIPVIPSTRGMVYAARFRESGGRPTREMDDRELGPEEMGAMVKGVAGAVTLVGAGALLAATYLPAEGELNVREPLTHPVSEGVARLAALGAGERAIPRYISRSQAEINWERSQTVNH